jgi:hypothetical protein
MNAWGKYNNSKKPEDLKTIIKIQKQEKTKSSDNFGSAESSSNCIKQHLVTDSNEEIVANKVLESCLNLKSYKQIDYDDIDDDNYGEDLDRFGEYFGAGYKVQLRKFGLNKIGKFKKDCKLAKYQNDKEFFSEPLIVTDFNKEKYNAIDDWFQRW